MSFSLPTLMKDDSKCNHMGSREISVFIPNISANGKAHLSSLSSGALQPSFVAVTLARVLSDVFLLPLRSYGDYTYCRLLIHRNPVTHMGCRSLTPADSFLVLSHPRVSQPPLSAGPPPSLSSSCVALGKKIPLMDPTDL